jgi:dTDP-4-dehydrorhamnose reductase
MLATDLVPCLKEGGYEALALSEQELDITDEGAVGKAVTDSHPDIVFNCAAYTNVDQAEKEQALADAVNGFAIRNLCLACREHEITLVHFSTDYVFDGTKKAPYTIHDVTNPINAYGRSKRLGERYITDMLSQFYILRTSWLFGLSDKNFVETMLNLGKSQGRASVVTDEKGCPTWTKHLAQAAVELIDKDRCGVYHVTNSGGTSWFDFAAEIFQLSGIDVHMTRISAADLSRPAKRPANSILDPNPLPQVLGRQMPHWGEALEEYLNLRKERSKA